MLSKDPIRTAVPVTLESRPIARNMIAVVRPESANATVSIRGVISAPGARFSGSINWSCASCHTLLVQGVSEQYTEDALICYKCGQFNRTPSAEDAQ